MTEEERQEKALTDMRERQKGLDKFWAWVDEEKNLKALDSDIRGSVYSSDKV